MRTLPTYTPRTLPCAGWSLRVTVFAWAESTSDAWSPLTRKHYDRYGFDELDEQTPYADKDKKLVDFYEGSKV